MTQFSKDFCLISAAGVRLALNLVCREEIVNTQLTKQLHKPAPP